MEGVDEAVRGYIDGIPPEHRPLFDRLHRLILAVHPGAAVVLAYQIPTYKVGNRRLYVGAWKHGVSIYGWQQGRDAGFTARHPRSRRARGPSSCGPMTRPASPMPSPATWCAPPWRPNQNPAAALTRRQRPAHPRTRRIRSTRRRAAATAARAPAPSCLPSRRARSHTRGRCGPSTRTRPSPLTAEEDLLIPLG